MTFRHPKFLIIGAGKSGTTALFKYLQEHPQIFMPRVKEPDFFAVEGQTPVDPRLDPEMLYYYPQAVYTAEAYQELFKEATDDMMSGEASTMYLYKPDAHLRIKKYVPDVKMIAIFRNPAERLYSRYLHLARDDQQPKGEITDMFDKSTIWWRRHDLIYEGFFYRHLKKYFDLFPREQFKIFLYEDLMKENERVIREIYQFLGVDENYQPETGIRYNESGFIKNKFKDYLIGNRSLIRKSVEFFAPDFVQKLRDNPHWQKRIKQLRRKNLVRPPLEPALKQRINDEIYREDILKFQDLIGRDLSGWLVSEKENKTQAQEQKHLKT